MKLIKNLALLQASFCLILTGCVSRSTVVPLSNGYEEVTHPTRASAGDPETTRISIEYRGPDGRAILVWPSLYGMNEVVRDNVALFVGDQSYEQSDPDNPRSTKPRLFAVCAPGLPLDITDEILWRWSNQSGKDFTRASQVLSLASPELKNGQLVFRLAFWTDDKDWPESATIQLDWNQVLDLMRVVKEKGVVHKELRWGTPYIEKSP